MQQQNMPRNLASLWKAKPLKLVKIQKTKQFIPKGKEAAA